MNYLCFGMKLYVLCMIALTRLVNTEDGYLLADLNTCKAEQNEVFDLFQYQCVSCSRHSTAIVAKRKDEQTCECQSKHMMVTRKNRIDVKCSACTAKAKVPTVDGHDCTNCSGDDCKSCKQEKQIVIDRELDGSLVSRKCVDCVTGTFPDAQKTRCIPCDRDPLAEKIRVCPPCIENNNYEEVQGECLQKDKLLPNSPNLNKMYYGAKENVDSKLMEQNFRKAVYKCMHLKDRQMCSFIHNMCAAQLFDLSVADGPCNKYAGIVDAVSEKTDKPTTLFLTTSEEASIAVEHSFLNNKSRLNFKIAKYSVHGELLSIQSATTSSLQLCQATCGIPGKAFNFGASCSETCYINVRALWDTMTSEFYELFLEYDGGKKMISIPVRIKSQEKDVNMNDKFARRFFLIDNISGVPVSSTKANIVQYAKAVDLSIQIHFTEPSKRIHLPILTVEYAYATLDHYNENTELKITFDTNYWMSQTKLESNISIAIGVFSVLAIIYAAIQTWAWCKHSGIIALEFRAMGKFLLHVCSNLANMFLLIIFFVCFLIFLFYKNQRYVVMMLPTEDQEVLFKNYIISAFALKCVDMIHVIGIIVDIDIFFIDWERPRLPSMQGDGIAQSPTNTVHPVSIWRSYYIANEWNKVKLRHKTNTLINLTSLLFFLKLLNLETFALAHPDSNVLNGCTPYSQICRFCLIVLIFFGTALAQFLFRIFIYESFIVDSNLNQLTDLCSVSNVSIFILMHRHYGYYIHGRSVHGHADVDMKLFNEHLKREEENLCGQRGLVPNTRLQTFSVFVTPDFLNQYSKIKSHNIRESHPRYPSLTAAYFHANVERGLLTSEDILAYQTMNKFLASFIDHALQDLDYTVKDKLMSERLLNIEYQEPGGKSFFYNDRTQEVNRAVLTGHEITFLVWEVLLLSLVDLLIQDIIAAVIITAVSIMAIEAVYSVLSRKNLVLKSLLDNRFIMQ